MIKSNFLGASVGEDEVYNLINKIGSTIIRKCIKEGMVKTMQIVKV